MAEVMFDASSLGIGKGREGGYAIVAPTSVSPTSFEDMTKTLAELVAVAANKAQSLGYIDEDGVTNATDTDTDDKTDWAGDVIASPLTSYSETVEVKFLESRESVLKVVFGDDNVSTANGITTVRHNKNFTGAHTFVFDCVVSDTKVKRIIIPNGVITERDDIEYNNSDLMGYKPTIKCLKCSEYDGDTIRELIYDTTTGTVTSTKSN